MPSAPAFTPYATDPSFDYSTDSKSYLVRMSSSDATETRALADFAIFHLDKHSGVDIKE